MDFLPRGWVLAYKFLESGRSPFTRCPWPVPVGGQPGSWLETSGVPKLCANGIHACRTAQLPVWLGRDLWRVELGGEIIDSGTALVATRGRLVEPVTRWDDEARGRFARDCADRARKLAADRPDLLPVADLVGTLADLGHAAGSGYWSGVLAGQRVTGRRQGEAYDREFAAERLLQAEWLGRELALAD